jgi:hypothetical protein
MPLDIMDHIRFAYMFDEDVFEVSSQEHGGYQFGLGREMVC